MQRPLLSNAQLPRVVAITLIALLSTSAFAQDDEPISSNQKIRFYKVNKDLQGDRIMVTSKKSAELGCHNFIKQVRVHRAVQTGFVACSLYQDKDCPITKVVPVSHEKDPRRTYLLTEGLGWLPQSEEERGVKVKSWQCDLELEADLLGRDSQLAKTEVVRLRIKARRAKEIAEKAQKKAEQAEKASEESIESAAAALKRAIAAGYEPPLELGKSLNDESEQDSDSESQDKEKGDAEEKATKEQ